MRRLPLQRFITLAPLLLLLAEGASGAEAQVCRSGPVALTLRASLQLPKNSGIAGSALGPGGAVVLWGAVGELFLIQDGRVTEAKLPDNIHPAGMAFADGGLRFIDLMEAREYRRHEDGTLTPGARIPLPMAQVIDEALWYRGAWVLGTRDLVQRRFVLRRYDGSELTELYRSAASDSIKTIQRYHLSPSSRGVLLTGTMAPFAVLRLDPEAPRVDTLSPVLQEAAFSAPRDSLAHWRALPAVSLDCTLLLTLSDLTTDRRLLVRYGASDQVEQVTPLEAPIGLMARVPGEDAVLAARRAGELELVWYDWHWVREPIATP